ncbi:hypothetical protein P12x_004932 [Tundrisphaera lichenicola]|uniref:hypothetical protein n=1 Tax=Tundrisphaera lichenicola TaxID=2029860 RepID=UPI003EBDD24D
MRPGPFARNTLAVLWITALNATSPASGAENANSKVFPPCSNPHGLSYAEWSARQWQWLFSLPVDHHPLFDSADCSTGQSGKVWFLGGTFSTSEIEPGVILGKADRTCKIPSGTALFLPMVAAECSEIEGNGETEAVLRECANFFGDFIIPSSVFLEIDGKPVTNPERYRVESPLFSIGPLPENNVLGAAQGSTSPAVSDGYFAMVKPMSVGKHTLRFGGIIDVSSIGGPIFIQDIKYTIDVMPRGRY